MKITLEAFLIALVVVIGLTPAASFLGRRWGAVARLQTGAPLCAGFLAALGALCLAEPAAADLFGSAPSRILGVVAGSLCTCVIGAVGDDGGVRPLHKILLQIAVAVFAYACGFRILAVHVPLLGDFDTTAIGLPLTVIWIAGIINVVHFMDGLAGLAGGVAFFASATNLAVALLSDVRLAALPSAALAGAVLGSLVHALRPVTMGGDSPYRLAQPVRAAAAGSSAGLMGGSGSYFLGYVLATTALGASQKASTAVSLLVPVMALGVPIFDTLFAMTRRILERRSVFSPDRGHIHHRLLDMGITHGRAVLIIYAFCGVFTAVAIGVSFEHGWQVGAALFGASATLVGLVRFVGYFARLLRAPRPRARALPREAELLRRALPRLPLRFAETFTQEQLLDALWRLAEEVDLRFVEVIDTRDGGERRLQRWPAGDAGPGVSSERATAAAVYPLGGDAARVSVRFGCSAERGEVPEEVEILLQIAADLLAQHLGRVHSSLTMQPELTDEHEAPDVLDIPARPSRV